VAWPGVEGTAPSVPSQARCSYAPSGDRMRRMAVPDPSARPSTTGRPRRSPAIASLIWFLVGIFSAHRFYLGGERGGRRYIIALAIGIGPPVLGLAGAVLTGDIVGVSIGLASGSPSDGATP